MKSERFYKEYNEEYYKERYYPKHHIIKYIKFLLKQKENIRWLDVGCGQGYLVRECLKEGIDCYGIDISEYAVKNAVVKDKVVYGSITDIPFEDNSFDVISAFDVIEHIHPKDTEKAFSEIYRVLKKDGFLILTMPNPCYIGNWIYDLTHINVRPLKYWKLILKDFGFKLKVEYVPSFLKYYIYQNFSVSIPIPDKVAFWLEEPIRHILGKIYSKKGRIYIVAWK